MRTRFDVATLLGVYAIRTSICRPCNGSGTVALHAGNDTTRCESCGGSGAKVETQHLTSTHDVVTIRGRVTVAIIRHDDPYGRRLVFSNVEPAIRAMACLRDLPEHVVSRLWSVDTERRLAPV